MQYRHNNTVFKIVCAPDCLLADALDARDVHDRGLPFEDASYVFWRYVAAEMFERGWLCKLDHVGDAVYMNQSHNVKVGNVAKVWADESIRQAFAAELDEVVDQGIKLAKYELDGIRAEEGL